MNKYIEFSSSPRQVFSQAALGNPIHDGKLPSRLADSVEVRVDHHPVSFNDESIPELLHRALHRIRERPPLTSVNCRAFAALMFRPDLADQLPTDFLRPDLSSAVTAHDQTITAPVILGTFGDALPFEDNDFHNRHMAVPSQQADQATYLHKLGQQGPICLSGLQAAMDIYACTHAYQPRGITSGRIASPSATLMVH